MSKTWLFILCLGFLWLMATQQVVASSGLTTSASGDGQVIVRNENGVMYLTTQTNAAPDENVATVVTATDSATPPPVEDEAPLDEVDVSVPEGFATTFSGLINGVLSFVLVIAALLVFLFLIWGAFDWITSGGDKGKTERARQKIFSAIIGLIIIASSYAILTLALRFLGFTSLNDVFDSAGTIRGGAETEPSPSPSPETQLETLLEPTPTPL